MKGVLEASVAFSSWFFRTTCLFMLFTALPLLQENTAVLAGPGMKLVSAGTHYLEIDPPHLKIQENHLKDEEVLDHRDSPGEGGSIYKDLPEDEEGRNPLQAVSPFHLTDEDVAANRSTAEDVAANRSTAMDDAGSNNTSKDSVAETKDKKNGLDTGSGCETIVENTERMIISVVKRDTMRLDSEGKSVNRRQSYSEMILQDSLITKRIRHGRHKSAQVAYYPLEEEDDISNDLRTSLPENNLDNSLHVNVPSGNVPWMEDGLFNRNYYNTDYTNQYNSIKERRGRHRHNKHPTRKSYPYSDVQKLQDKDRPNRHEDKEKVPATFKPSIYPVINAKTSSAPSRYTLIRRNKPYLYSTKSPFDATMYLKMMSFKGYHRKTEDEAETEVSDEQSFDVM